MATIVSDVEVRHVRHLFETPDRAAAAIAGSQLGVITVGQLVGAGLGRHPLADRAERGVVTRLYRGVYLWGAPPAPPGALELAGCLACGPGTCVSHESAAWLWGLVPAPREVEVTVPGRNARTRLGLRVHRVPALAAADVADVRGIPVTSPARVLLDLAGRRDDDVLEHALSDAFARHLVTERELDACRARNRGRRGGPTLRRRLDGGPKITRSKAERLLLRIIRDAGLPMPRTNVKIEGKYVDAYWPEHNLIVETDGYAVHGHRAAFESDRASDQRLIAAGYRVMRITWRQLTDRPLLVAANLAAALSRGA